MGQQIKTRFKFILECTADHASWVAGYPDGSMVVTWDNQVFMKTLNIMVDKPPQTAEEKRSQMDKISCLIDWLSEYHFEKMHREM